MLIYTLLLIISIAVAQLLHPACDFCHLESEPTSDNLIKSFLEINHDLPVVDVYFVIVGLAQYDFVKNSQFWVAINVLRRFANCKKVHHLLLCDTRIHLITDSQYVVDNTRKLGRPFYVHEMKLFNEISLPFKKLYSRTHHTVNSLDYEFLCFNRWLIMNNITQSWNARSHLHAHRVPMTRILSLDLDVLMTMNAAKFADNLIKALSKAPIDTHNNTSLDHHFEVIVVGLGAINLFSAKGLQKFATFVFDWFNRPVEIVRAANDHYMQYFSDMMIMKHYIENAPNNATDSINACYEYWKNDHYYEWRDVPHQKCLLQKLGCVPMSGYREMMAGNTLQFFQGHTLLENSSTIQFNSTLGPINVKGTIEVMPYCLIHFQGVAAKLSLHYYGILVEHLQRKSSVENANLYLVAPPPIVANRAGTKELKLIANGSQFASKDWDAFLKHGLNNYPRISGVPPYLLDFFPEGEMLV